MTIDLSKPLERIVALLPADMVEKADALALRDPRFHLFGKPSRAAVIREAMALFFADDGTQVNHLALNNTDSSPIESPVA